MATIYYNVELSSGRKDATQGQARAVQTNVTFSTPLLRDMSEYNVSVVRAKIPLSIKMPLFINELLDNGVGESDGINTKYTITINDPNAPTATKETTVRMRMIQENFISTKPVAPLTKQPDNEYAFNYSMSAISMMIRNALQEAFVNLYGAATPPTTGNVDTATIKPFVDFWYDSDLEKFRFMIGPISKMPIDPATKKPFIKIQFSPNFTQYLNGFHLNQYPAYTELDLTLTQSSTYTYPLTTTVGPPATSTVDYGAPYTQQTLVPFSTVGLPEASFCIFTQQWMPKSFNAIQSILITSSIPTLPETSQKIERINTAYKIGENAYQLQANFDSINILQDFIFDPSDRSDFCNTLVYNSSTVRFSREVAIIGSGPLQSFNIAMKWVDSNGILHQMETNDTVASNILLAFIPKL
jgi:hypothetical protein